MAFLAVQNTTTTGNVDYNPKPIEDAFVKIGLINTLSYTGVTFTVSASMDGTNFAAVRCIDDASGSYVAAGTTISPSDGTARLWTVPADGYVAIRVIVTAQTGGTAGWIFNGYNCATPAAFNIFNSAGNAIAGNQTFNAGITFAGTTGVNILSMPDNLADALSFAEGANEYLTFTTTDSSEAVKIKKQLSVTSATSTAFAVGRQGTTSPGLLVDASTSTCVTGVKVVPAASGAGVAQAAIGGNNNENYTIDAVGSGVIKVATVSTGGAVLRTLVGTVAAGGTAIGNANAVAEGFYYVTGADNTAAVILPASVVGKVVRVKNTTSTAILPIFPPVSSQINAKGVNNSYNIANAAVREFVCVSTTLWYCSPETIA